MGIIKPPPTIQPVFPLPGPSSYPSSDAALFGGGNAPDAMYGGIPVTSGEAVLVRIINTATVTLKVNVRIAIPATRSKPMVQGGAVEVIEADRYQILSKTITPGTSGAAELHTIPAFVGFVQSVYISVTSGTPGATDTYCEVGVASGKLARDDQWVMLLNGFVTSQYAISSAYQANNSITGQGSLTLYSASGAATASLNQVVPTSTRWIFKHAYMQVTTSAVAGNRRPRFRLLRPSAGTVIFDAPGAVNQAPSLTYTYLYGPHFDTSLVVDTITAGSDEIVRVGVPELVLFAGDGFSTVFTGNQAGDTCVVRVQFESWITA